MNEFIKIMVDAGVRSTSYLQSKMRISYEEAKKICDELGSGYIRNSILTRNVIERIEPHTTLVKKIKQRS